MPEVPCDLMETCPLRCRGKSSTVRCCALEPATKLLGWPFMGKHLTSTTPLPPEEVPRKAAGCHVLQEQGGGGTTMLIYLSTGSSCYRKKRKSFSPPVSLEHPLLTRLNAVPADQGEIFT